MSNPTPGPVGARVLPARPSLEHLKNEAKHRLEAMRAASPGSQLSDAQFQLAREYGFASWRELKADIDRRRGLAGFDPAGDWIGELVPGSRIALHIRRDASGRLEGRLDARDSGRFDTPVDDLLVENDHLSYAVLTPSVSGPVQGFYEGRWDSRADKWVGTWTAMGVRHPLNFTRGVYPPAATVEGLDGLWDGRLDVKTPARLVFRFRTDSHGTFGWVDSLDRGIRDAPARMIQRVGQDVTIAMRTLTVAGRLSDDGQTIDGRFRREDGVDLPLVLVKRPPGAPAPLAVEPEAVDLPPEALAAFVGRYRFTGGEVLIVSLEEGRLRVSAPGWPSFDLIASGPRIFFWRTADTTFEFETAPDGRVASLVQRSPSRESRGLRVG